MIDVDLGAKSPAVGGKGIWSQSRCWGIFLQFFNKNNAILGMFGQNSYFNAISRQSKAFTKQS